MNISEILNQINIGEISIENAKEICFRIENFPKELWISDARNFLNICGKIELVFHDDEEYHINGISNEINPCEGVRGTCRSNEDIDKLLRLCGFIIGVDTRNDLQKICDLKQKYNRDF